MIVWITHVKVGHHQTPYTENFLDEFSFIKKVLYRLNFRTKKDKQMKCFHCKKELGDSLEIKFCHYCGELLCSQSQSHIKQSGVGNSIQQARGDIYNCYNNIKSEKTSHNNSPVLKKKWHKVTPLSKSILKIVCKVFAIPFFMLVVMLIVSSLKDVKSIFIDKNVVAQNHQHWLIWMVVSLFILLIIASTLYRIAKNKTIHFSPLPLLPSIVGWGEKIGFAKLEGQCTMCGGDLRFYAKPLEWIDDLDNGKRKITKRAAAAEYIRNPEHCWHIDSTCEF